MHTVIFSWSLLLMLRSVLYLSLADPQFHMYEYIMALLALHPSLVITDLRVVVRVAKGGGEVRVWRVRGTCSTV